MRQTIGGVIYDTETSVEVASVEHPTSDAWWALYRTLSGAFFAVVVDHDGATTEFQPLSTEQARRFVERHANHLVEKYFGPMGEPHPLRFSRRTIIAAIEVMEATTRTHANLTRFLLKLDPDIAARCDAGALPDRFNQLIKFFDENPSHRVPMGDLLGDTLVEDAIPALPTAGSSAAWRQRADDPHYVIEFLRRLDLDGYIVAEGVLRCTLPSEFELPQAEDDITRLLNKHRFTTPKGHLDQALDAHARGEWASANGQLRTFFESLLDEMAISLDSSSKALASSENRRARLASLGLLSEPLNEWSNDGKNLINGIWKRLHPAGSHPGLSDLDDSTFRRHIVLLTARLLLLRFDAMKSP